MPSSFRIRVGIVICLLAASFQAAAGELFWDARKLVARNGATGTTTLRATDGKEVQAVDNARVATVVEVVDQIGPHFGLRPEVGIIAGKSPNAFATRNKEGQPLVVFNTAMLDVTGTDKDLTAAVVGHELGHLHLKHVEETQQRQAAVNVIALIAGAALGYNVAKRGVDASGVLDLSMFGGAMVNRKFDRDQERAADEVGIKAMNASGYDVYAAPRMWVAMNRVTTGGSGLWLSTHPSHAERIESLTRMAVAMRPQGTATTMVASAPASARGSTDSVSTASLRSEYVLTGGESWCLVSGKSAECAFRGLDECMERGGDCRERSALSLASASTTDSTSSIPQTLLPVTCMLPDGTSETLPRVQCASRGGTAE